MYPSNPQWYINWPSTLVTLKQSGKHKGRKQVEEFLNVVGIIFPIKHWNCADNQNDSGRLAESSFQWNTRIILQVNCFVLRSTKQFTYRMILVFHWNDDSAKRPESFWLSVSKQHNSNVLLERWFQQHLGILQLAWPIVSTKYSKNGKSKLQIHAQWTTSTVIPWLTWFSITWFPITWKYFQSQIDF